MKTTTINTDERCKTCGYSPDDRWYAITHQWDGCQTSEVDYVVGYPMRRSGTCVRGER